MSKKTVNKYFSVSQWEEEETYLREMHRSGWAFQKVTGLGRYHFTSCEPEDVVYRLDYNKEAAQDPEEYRGIFADCGWEYLQDFMGYSYFRKKASEQSDEDNEIFGDFESKLDMCKRVLTGRILPLFAILCGIIIPQLFMTYDRMKTGDTSDAVVFGLFVVLFVLYMWIFGSFANRYYKLKHRYDR